MANEAEILREFMEGRRKAVIQSQSQKGIRASGKSAAGLRVEQKVSDTTIETTLIDGTGTFQFQEEGRRPGRFPPIDAIYEWLAHQKYGLSYSGDKERRSLAFVIARNIARQGTYTHRTGGQSGVVTDSGFQEALAEMGSKLTDFHKAHITETLKKAAAL